MSRRLIVGIFVFIICICGLIQPAQAYLEGTKVKGAVLSKDYRGQFDWPDPVATISYSETEFVREFTNVTTTVDITENTLILTYENTSPWPNVTYPPLTYLFKFQIGCISDLILVDSTFSHEIVPSFTSNSIILEVGLQNTNPGEIFTATFKIVHDWEGTELNGTVFSKDYPGQFDWPDPVATISYTEEEFVREFTNVTTTADITEYGLTLTYENTSPWPNITYPPLTYVFEFEEENISNVFLIDSTFSHEIVTSFTSDSVTLEVGLQNTNPGEIFTARFAVIYCDELSK